jgi:microcystin synthetase protein McyJ
VESSRGGLFYSAYKAFEAVLLTPKLLLNPNPSDYYEFLGNDVVEGLGRGDADPNKPLWLNLGYWKDARTYPEAAAALASLVAEAAQLKPGDRLLDVGFGFAEQDLFWLERYGVAHITGINITQMQVDRARERVALRGLAERIDLRFGSATELPLPANSFDKVTALECAHHFDTRERFFAEAFRVLAPGGMLATADGTPSKGDGALSLVNKIALRRWCVPLANMYDPDEYCRRLEAAGFVDAAYRSIRNYVFPGCVKYSALRNRGVSMQDAVVELTAEDVEQCTGLDLWKVTGITDYLIFSARKPG